MRFILVLEYYIPILSKIDLISVIWKPFQDRDLIISQYMVKNRGRWIGKNGEKCHCCAFRSNRILMNEQVVIINEISWSPVNCYARWFFPRHLSWYNYAQQKKSYWSAKMSMKRFNTKYNMANCYHLKLLHGVPVYSISMMGIGSLV